MKQPSANLTTPGAAAAPLARRELLLLAVILAVGIGLRIAALSQSAVEHFDEGVYASNVWFGPPEFAYPQRTMYAPPLLPWLIEAGILAGISPNLAALLPGFLAGIATIAALWWFGRSWLGPPVGLATATLAALSDYHVAYSATALTDVLLGLWIVLAVDAAARSLDRIDFRWAIAAGFFTGMAWWTKYNGWLPLAIEGAAIPLLWLVIRPPLRQVLRWLACFGVTLVVAAVIWSPYYLSLAPGEYAAITANHARAVVGLAGWLNSTSRHVVSQHAMEGLASQLSVAIALGLVVAVTSRWSEWSIKDLVCLGLIAGFLVALALFGTAFEVVLVAAPLGLVEALLASRRGAGDDGQRNRERMGLCLVMAWWGGMIVATPCYWPFPRLVVPLVLASWLGAAVCLREVVRGWKAQHERHPLPYCLGAALTLAALAGLAIDPFHHELSTARGGMAAIARDIRMLISQQAGPRAIYVFGEPALFFHLKVLGESAAMPVESLPREPATLEGEPIPTYIVAGPHARRDPRFMTELKAAQSRWEHVGSFHFYPSAIVWLDLHEPRAARPTSTLSPDDVLLFRLKSAR
jgi:4-amino-4-deoxy-L-arabinose transferase-like glycosyltransferase